MSFSASTCLINTGTTTLGPTLVLHSNADGYLTSFGTVNTSDIIGGNCPYVITNIPDGTTIIRLSDTISNCCVYVEILSDEICNTCNIGFDSFSSDTVSLIVAGTLTGTCEDEITDYVINWYGSDNTVKYVSGYGDYFSGYSFTHPLTVEDNTAIFAQSDTYTPIIDKILINGVVFSSTGGTGSGVYKVNLDCFDNVTVEPLTCDNGNSNPSVSPFYSHIFSFNSTSNNSLPRPLDVTFELSPSVQYFPWRFQGNTVPDTLRITFSGSSYPVPLELDYITVGGNLPSTRLSPLNIPKSANTASFINKILCLTGLTINNGDKLNIQITPNQSVNQTDWSIGFRCLNTFDCSTCIDDYLNTPFKIIGSTITGITGSCDTITINFQLSGCTRAQVLNSDLGKYVTISTSNLPTTLNETTGSLFFNNISCTNVNSSGSQICSSSNTNTITFQKTSSGGQQGVINMTFSNVLDFDAYYNSYLSIYTSFSGTPSNPNNLDYYRYFSLTVPSGVTSSSSCLSDQSRFLTYNIHPSSTIITGLSPYSLTIYLSSITNSIVSNCGDCSTLINNLVNTVNQSSTGNTSTAPNNISFTSTTGSRITTPFYRTTYITSANTVTTGHTISRTLGIDEYYLSTYTSSGSSSTIIPSLTAQTCDFANTSRIIQRTGGLPSDRIFRRELFASKVELFNPSDVRDFRIYSSPITNGQWSGTSTNPSYDLVYEFSGGVVTYLDSLYVI